MHRILLIVALWLWSTVSSAQPHVVVSILPLHSLVAAVMQTVAEPELLMPGGSSPHDYSLRPSDVRSLNQATVVFWIGEGLETVLTRPLANSPAQAVAMLEIPGLDSLALREGGLWDAHSHDHGHSHGHSGDNQHHGDTHIWLDPRRAALMATHIANVLSEHDPHHAPQYQNNAAALRQRLHTLEAEIARRLEPVQAVPYIVFHDAYQYFEQRFNTTAVGSITLNPERRPGARRILDIRQRIQAQGAHCVFSEPQFQPALVNTVIEGTQAHSGILDPLGATLTPGPEAYFQLLQTLSDDLLACLSIKPHV